MHGEELPRGAAVGRAELLDMILCREQISPARLAEKHQSSNYRGGGAAVHHWHKRGGRGRAVPLGQRVGNASGEACGWAALRVVRKRRRDGRRDEG